MQQTGIFAGRTEVRCPYARWGWTRGGGKVWHGGLDLAGLDDATIRMPYYKGKRITGRVTRARIVTDRQRQDLGVGLIMSVFSWEPRADMPLTAVNF